MHTLDEYFEWFRMEAQHLDAEIRPHVLGALDHKDPRQVFLNLDRLNRQAKLPGIWNSKLDEFFWLFCH